MTALTQLRHFTRGIVLCVLILQPMFTHGQITMTSAIRGTVSIRGAAGTLIYLPGIKISLRCEGTKGNASITVSDDRGEFLFQEIQPGSCQLEISDPRFESIGDTVECAAGQSITHDLQLHIRQQEQNVIVSAEAQGIDTTTSSTAAPAISQQAMQSAPLISGRFQDALPLIPGVIRGPDGLLNIHGGRSDQSNTLVNSVGVADPVTGHEAISLPLDAVESVKVLPNPFSAEYGGFTSGVAEVETRAGTDHWKTLLTNFFPRPRRRAGTVMGIGSFTPRLTLAGPLQKEKLYLFQSWDYRFVRTSVPSLPPLQHDMNFETFNSSTQFDWNASGTNRLTADVIVYPENVRYALLNTFLPEGSNPNLRRRGYLTAFHDRQIMGSDVLESTLSIKRYDVHIFPAAGTLGGFILYPEQDSGAWYNQQDRNSWIDQGSQIFRVESHKFQGDHSLVLGYSFVHRSYGGTFTSGPVTVIREDQSISQEITFGESTYHNSAGDLLALFVQDHWTLSHRAALDLGVRLDHDSLSNDALNAAPRLGFVVLPRRNDKTALRGGIGVFYSPVPLDVTAFLQFPAETVTTFPADDASPVTTTTLFAHEMTTPALRLPYGLAWNAELDHEISPSFMVRLMYDERHTRHDFFVNPAVSGNGPSTLQLWNTGRQRYRELELTLRWQAADRTKLFASFVHSSVRGDMNSFDQYFGDFPDPIIRANQYGTLRNDVPNRFLFWGSVGLPWKWEFWPVLDVRSGFPYSRVDGDLAFVGKRNDRRFPEFASFDCQLVRAIHVPFLRRDQMARVGVKVFNATNHFNPRDVQNNISSSAFGHFYNSMGTQFGGKLEFDF